VTVIRAVVFGAGAAVVLATFGSALRTVVVPRGIRSLITRYVFLTMRQLFRLRLRLRRASSYERTDRIMAAYAPASLLNLVLVWVAFVLSGYAAMYWGLGGRSVREAFTLSGSSVFTLGVATPDDLPTTVLVFTEAALGLVILALLITYLPSLYSAFSRREQMVLLLEARAGAPPTAIEMIERTHRIGGLGRLGDIWPVWETWFADVEETHTSNPALVFFRSTQPQHSWVVAGGAVLDAASITLSTVDLPTNPDAQLCIRAGYICLRRIATFFGIPFDDAPAPDDPITIGRQEFDAVYDRLAGKGIPVKPDRDQAWRDFNGWRVNYDTVLLALSALTMAPPAPWTSDRSQPFMRDLLVWGRIRRRAVAS
jgi:hypothetical protein